MKKVALFCVCFTFFVLVFASLFGSKYKNVSLQIFEKPREFIIDLSDGIYSFINQKHLFFENQSLKEKLTAQNTSADYERIKSENEELKKALSLSEKRSQKCVTARVTAINTDANFRITLDRGANHGVSRNDVVVFGNALAGKISEVYPAYSIFIPVTAEENTTGIADKNNTPGIVTGSISLSKKNMCNLSFFSDSEATPGDEIVTSGLSDIYPAGLLVGKIHSIDKDITVKTETDFFKTRIFSVILSQ